MALPTKEIRPAARVAQDVTTLQKTAIYVHTVSGTHGLNYIYSSARVIPESQGGLLRFTVYDPNAPQPPNTRVMVRMSWTLGGAASNLYLVPQGMTLQQFIAQQQARGWGYDATVGYCSDDPDPLQDTQPLHYLTVGGNAQWNNYFTYNQAEIAELVRQGWIDYGVFAHVMPIYQVAVSLDGNDVRLVAAIENRGPGDPDPGDFKVGAGRGNTIVFAKTDSAAWAFTNVTFTPNDGQFDITRFDGTQVVVTDNNVDQVQTSYEYSVTVRTADGHSITHDPKVINRLGIE